MIVTVDAVTRRDPMIGHRGRRAFDRETSRPPDVIRIDAEVRPTPPYDPVCTPLATIRSTPYDRYSTAPTTRTARARRIW